MPALLELHWRCSVLLEWLVMNDRATHPQSLTPQSSPLKLKLDNGYDVYTQASQPIFDCQFIADIHNIK